MFAKFTGGMSIKEKVAEEIAEETGG